MSLRRYLASFPQGARAGQTALDLGHLLANQAHSEAAVPFFQRAATDSDPAVQRAAQQALERLSER